MSQNVHETNVNSARHLSLWLAAIGFFLFALGTLVFSWFPAEGAFEFTLQTLGPILIAVSLLVNWRTNVARWGRGPVILFFLFIISYGAIWLPYIFSPESLGTESATQRGFYTTGIGIICGAIGVFMVMHRKETQLEHPTDAGRSLIGATFTELLLIGVGVLLNGINWIWIGQEDSHLAEFSLPLIGCVLILIAVISASKALTVRLGRPATIAIILAVFVYALHYLIDVLPAVLDPDWRQTMRVSGVSYALAGVACVLAAVHKGKAAKVG
jgi:hypothetical protein